MGPLELELGASSLHCEPLVRDLVVQVNGPVAAAFKYWERFCRASCRSLPRRTTGARSSIELIFDEY